MKIEHATVLVTGANRGIGRALTERLLARGAAHVIATARTQASLDAVAALDAERVTPLLLDITNADQIAETVGKAAGVTLLINNAGMLLGGDTPEILETQMATNCYGTLNMMRAMAPVLKSNGGGAIVNLLSIVSLANMPVIASYCASKAAAWSMTLAMRATLATDSITVHGVYPGPVDTDMTRDFDMPKATPTDVANAILDGIEAGQEDIFPDAISQEVYGAWSKDHKAVETQFAAFA